MSDPFQPPVASREAARAVQSVSQAFGPTDPLVHSSFREALAVSGIWIVAMCWSVGVCYFLGYDRPPEDLKLVFGFPDWIFWGIVVPWTTCTVVSWVFGAVCVRDGDLGRDMEDRDEFGAGA